MVPAQHLHPNTVRHEDRTDRTPRRKRPSPAVRRDRARGGISYRGAGSPRPPSHPFCKRRLGELRTPGAVHAQGAAARPGGARPAAAPHSHARARPPARTRVRRAAFSYRAAAALPAVSPAEGQDRHHAARPARPAGPATPACRVRGHAPSVHFRQSARPGARPELAGDGIPRTFAARMPRATVAPAGALLRLPGTGLAREGAGPRHRDRAPRRGRAAHRRQGRPGGRGLLPRLHRTAARGPDRVHRRGRRAGEARPFSAMRRGSFFRSTGPSPSASP